MKISLVAIAGFLSGLLLAGCEPEKPKPPPSDNPVKQPVESPVSIKPRASKSLMRRRLERSGHVLKDGHWFKKETWSWGINNLWDVDGTPWKEEGVKVRQYWAHVSEMSVVGAGPGFPTEITLIRKKWGPENLRFFAPPPPGKGTVTLPVDLPDNLATCSVRAPGEIHARDKRGSIRVSVAAGGETKERYFIDGGRNDDPHDISDLVKENRKF